MKQVLLAPSEIIKPADHADRLPLLASLKMDGNRMLVHRGRCYTRSMKEQPNKNIRAWIKQLTTYSALKGVAYDGELYCHDIPFNELQEIVRSHDAPIPEGVQFCIFDRLTDSEWERPETSRPFARRIEWIATDFDQIDPEHGPARCREVKQVEVQQVHHIEERYESALRAGYEGLILRDPMGRYRHGRATVRQGIIFKLKPFDTLDAKVIGYEQQQKVKDGIERKTNEMGRTARTHKAEDHELVECLGALRVRDERGREFSVGWGRGWDYAKRTDLWARRATLVGQWVEVRFMAVGEKDLPRMPQLVRFRDQKE